MLSFLPPIARGVIALTALIINTLFWCTPLLMLAVLRLLLPFESVRARMDPVLHAIATHWIACNSAWMRLTQSTAWDVDGLDGLKLQGWYLVNCNHQSWVDITAVQNSLNLETSPLY
jgi:1-acyl-sn-glycerol-3-phosphate acyltransferase